jgi:ABC-type amino acid transport substrate-binding protein
MTHRRRPTVQALLAGALLAVGVGAWAAEGATLRVGMPDGLLGFDVPAGGAIVIDDPMKRRVLACIERKLNVPWVWHVWPTRRVLQGLRTGALDVAFPMGFTPERERDWQPSLPLWDNPDVWLSLKPINVHDRRLRLAARLGSPQHVEYAADGYRHVAGYPTYTELAKTIALGVADAAVVPRSLYDQHRGLWPEGTLATPGRARSSGFYVARGDPRGLLPSLNRAIEACREPTRPDAKPLGPRPG